MAGYQTLRLILGDQLNASHSWFKKKDKNCLYLIAELRQETDYVRHHVQKVAAFFQAMDNFATALQKAGHQVIHLTLDQTSDYQDLPDLLAQLCKKHKVAHFEYQLPDEYRLRKQLKALSLGKVEITAYETEHFLVPEEEISKLFPANKAIRMESFYRKMRKRFNILMEGDEPVGNRWNFDTENRKKIPASELRNIPQPLIFKNDIRPILDRIKKHKVKTIGQCSDTLLWPTTRQQSLKLLKFFCDYCLSQFGTYQDAMTANSPHSWSLYHSRLSFAMNSKMLSPGDVINKAIKAWQDNPKDISLAQIEGFVRQILGWREYMRGMYWANMPDYANKNELKASNKLPAFFWDGNTRMNCMKQAIDQSLEYAYAHHIQRLMVTGNFCLLTGIAPEQVDEWYLGIYIDAIEWVEMPNTRGMSQFADGGLIASKPYTASGNYIQKMSDYCSGCQYNVKLKTGETACPFNSLYWHFMNRHRKRLENNPRISMLFKGWDKRENAEKQGIIKHANALLKDLNSL
ncbi:cryptochrome/photolyase family protein [Parendozoicomonas haliclonae]|uniref:Deoxyribodipyrimidine photo-lyase-related protein n=1 Tax=Parendozoicomonas haliclonae TaxID=1960125 RepID=A0A1X7ALY0_9GAMM|nr:cryptochrome/photolyase family protein [Parendozoicomonas haliclonae]SMA48768.1 Deoxyribodipyrimidine photo-lyase-related protein [Parendozoicomonas haliclonae]